MMKMNEPLLPSFSNSRTYTYESDDNVNNEDMSSVADSSMASESLGGDAASMTSSNAVMSSPGINIPSPGSSSNNGSSNNNGNNGNNGGNGNGVSPGSYSAKSARFKSAMTTRARQRRMRRMREREPSSSQSHSQSQSSHQSPDNGNRSNNGGNNNGDGKSTVMTSRSNTAALLPSSPGTPGSRSSIDGGGGGGGGGDLQPLPSSSPGIPPIPTQPASHGGSNNPPTSPGSADRIQGAKDHVEQMKLHRSRAGTTTTTTTTPAVTAATTTATTTGSPPPPPTSMTPNTTNNNAPSSSFASPTGSTTSNNTVSPLQNRVYQAHRSRSLSRSREMSPSSSSVASYSYSSPSSDHHRRSELPSPNNLSFSSGGSNNNNSNNNSNNNNTGIIIINGANAHNSNSRSPSNVPKATMSQRSSSDGSFPTMTTTSSELERNNNNNNNNNRQNMPTPVMMSNNASSVDAFLSTQSTNQQSTLNNNNMSYQLPDRNGSNSDDASFPRYTDMDNNPSFYDSFEQLRQQQQQEQQQSTPDTSSKLPNPYVNNHDAFPRQHQEQHQQPAPPDGDNSFYNPREHHHHPQEQEQQEQPIPPPPPPPPKQPNPNAPTTAFQQHPTLPARTTPKQTRRSKRDKYEASQTKTEEFLPDWKKGDSISDAVLTGDEVRDAANFTSIQFQCSNLSGEVEMFSDQGSINAPDGGGGGGFDAIAELASVGSGELDGTNEDSRDFKQLWQNEVWINNSRTNNSMGGSDVGRGGALSPAQYGRTKSDLVQSNLGGGGGGGGDGHSEATTPSIFHRGEIFHQKAAASIVSLLSPDRMFEAGLMAPEITQSEEDDAAKDVEGDSPTGVAPPGGPRDLNGMFTFDGDADPSSSRGGEWKGTTQVKRSLFEEGGVGGGVGGSSDADDDVRKSVIFQKFRERMMQPSSQLSELLGQIHRASGRVAIDRAFATRRKNACGALKILSAKVENRMKICWTIGVLPAIASVLSDVHEGISDDLARAANTEARNRVVSTLLNLSVNKKNRMLIVNTPGVLESMMQTIKYDMGEGRQGCCTVLLYLAKTAEARGMIVKSAGMMDVLAEVVAVPKKQTNPPILKNKARSPRVMMLQTPAQRPTRPLSPNDENTLEGTTVDGTTVDGTATVDTGRSSFRSRSGSYSDGDDDDDSRTSDGSHYSGTTHSGDSKSSVDSRKSDYDHDEDSQDSRTVESSVDDRGKAVKHVEISFERASTAQTGNLASPGGTAAVGKGGVNTKAKVGDAATAARGKKLPNEDDEDIYDADPNRFLHGARLSIFACLLCLVKSRENAYLVAREVKTVEALIGVSRRHPSPSHSRAMAILAHLTRHPKNCHTLVYNYSSLLPMLQGAMASPDKEARRYAFCALQNLSMDKSCRAPIAHSPKIIWSLTERCKLGLSPSGGDKHDRKTSPYLASSLSDDNEDEARVAAVATLQNLSDEPANLIQFTIVKDCIGTIIQIAREDVVRNEKTDLTSFMAKNTLVTLSHWFRKIATSGSERMGGKGLGNMACIPHPGNGRDSTAMVRGNSGGSDRNQVGADVHLRTQMYLYNARLEPTIFDQWT